MYSAIARVFLIPSCSPAKHLLSEHIPEIVRVHNPAINNPLQRIIRSDVKETVKASTGWLDNERRLYLAELLGSPEVYEIIRGKLYPVMMTKQTMIAARDNEELQAVNIDYEMVESFLCRKRGLI